MPNFKARRAIKSDILTINAPPEVVFPLLCPVKESRWLADWTCRVLFSESGVAEKNGVYATPYSEEEDTTIWFVTQHDPDGKMIEFVYFVPGNRVTRLTMAVSPLSSESSKVDITYIHTAINEEGNKFIDYIEAEPHFVRQMQHWEKSINYYLASGKVMKTS